MADRIYKGIEIDNELPKKLQDKIEQSIDEILDCLPNHNRNEFHVKTTAHCVAMRLQSAYWIGKQSGLESAFKTMDS